MRGRPDITTEPSAAAKPQSRFPRGWYEAFGRSLQRNPNAERLRAYILPRCDLRELARFAVLYVQDLTELANSRTRRGKEVTSRLRKRARLLHAELAAPVIIDSAQHRERELELVRGILMRSRQAFDTKQMGVSGNHFMLFILREYLQFRSSLAPKPRDLAALVRAAFAALGRPPGYRIVDSDLLSRNLRNFERNRPMFCQLARGQASVVFVEGRPHSSR